MKAFKLGMVLCVLSFVAKAQTNCDIKVSIQNGCNPLPVNYYFSSTGKATAVSWLWDFGDGTTSGQQSPGHVYITPGKYFIKVTVKFNDSTKCTAYLAKPIEVFSNPNVDFTVNNSQKILLCSRGQTICFKDKSSPGADKAPIRSWLWSFGDGSLATSQNPCYAYGDSGTYLVTLEVIDSNGCKNHIQKKVTVRYTTDLGINVSPAFKIYIAYDCKKFVDNIIFTNTTDTVKNSITKFYWDYGDGTGDTCSLQNPACISKWTGFVHTYSKSGTYLPSLFIQNKYGCTNRIVIDTPISIDSFKLSLQVFPNYPTCYTIDSLVNFIAPFSNKARYYLWDFGDPYRRGAGVLPAAAHIYSRPGIYTVHFKCKIGTCLYDSILCKKVTLLGPVAKIMPLKGSSEAWDKIPPNGSYLLSPSMLYTYFDTSCFGPASKTYYTYASTTITNGEPLFELCKADTIKKYQPDSLVNCNGKKIPNILISYQPHVKSYKDTVEQIPTKHTWLKGAKIPTGSIYSNPPFINNPLFMDDSSLFSWRCKAPQKISFTNFSEKYRGYDAVDNFPPGYPDKCKNPSYPYASDSLSYRWDFREGNGGTSTKIKPDQLARVSTEKLPTHLFQKDGCYWVVLTVTDPVTNCTDQDSLPVVLQAADAGWAPQYSYIKNMTRLKQESLPASGPRRGLRIYGTPCLEDTQKISLSETLPSCYKPDFSMILDSAAQVAICKGTTKNLWMSKDSIAKYYSYHFLYADTGWKTVGLVVRNNYNCTDTQWYHFYNYIHGTYPGLTVSAKHICPGDTLKMSALVPQQQGIKSFVYYYAEERDLGDTIARFKNDTIRHKIIKHSGVPADTITSTVHNKDWGLDDGALNFNYLTDTIKKVVPQPGHFTIITVIRSRFGCVDTGRTQITVGHYADFSASNNTVCVNDTARFYGLAQYFLPFTKNGYGYDQRLFWNNPDSARHGRKPKIAEQMQWDLDGDGIIDYTGIKPAFIYKKPGSYTVTLYTRDSSGCVQKIERKNFIQVIGAKAAFGVKSPGDTRFCSDSHFFTFMDSSYVVKAFKDSLNKYKIYSWTWDFGDGSAPITITDTSKRNASHPYVLNGDFKVTLTVCTTPGGGANGIGCCDTFSRYVHIKGPVSHFTIIGPDKGCVPFTLTVRDESKYANSKREWILGDGTTVSSNGDSIIKLVYKKPGTFCPQFFVVDSLVDLAGKPLFCDDTFPTKCAIKVVVYKINIQNLSVNDTLLCARKDTAIFESIPDTGYKSWTLRYGDGDSDTHSTPKFEHSYQNTGKYKATITGRGARCPDTSSVKVHVIDIKADFETDTAKKDTPVFSFINKSIGGVRYTWDFGDRSTPVNTKSNLEISHEFIRAGKSTVCLTAYNEKGCSEQVCHDIIIDTFLRVPNVFTPNGDAFNNHFVITIFGNKLYDLDIFNRWGEKVFHSNDKNNTWDGTNPKTGQLYPTGGYYALFKYRFVGGRTEYYKTSVTLLRK